MTKDEALIYWVMRFGRAPVPPEDIQSDMDYRAFHALTPREGGWVIHHVSEHGWTLDD
jgi:hypothetical protein